MGGLTAQETPPPAETFPLISLKKNKKREWGLVRDLDDILTFHDRRMIMETDTFGCRRERQANAFLEQRGWKGKGGSLQRG